MNKTIMEQWNKCAYELAPYVKRSSGTNAPNIYSYMVYSSFTVIELYFAGINSISKDDFQFSTKEKFINNMKKLTKKEIKSLYVFFMLDYFAFLRFEMDERFFKYFPATYEQIWDGFKKAFASFPEELNKIDLVLEKYEYPYHPRTFLRRCGLPEEQDDLMLLESLNEMKFELFHQFNKNITRYVNNTSFKFD